MIQWQRDHLLSIVSAVTSAVDPYRLLTERLALESPEDVLTFDGNPVFAGDNQAVELKSTGKILVVGGGKAAAGFAAGLEHLLGSSRLKKHNVHGLVSVPEGCGMPLDHIEVRETRPHKHNLPTEAVVQATHTMLKQLRNLTKDDLAFVLITGGSSALIEVLRADIPLHSLALLTQSLSNSGVDIKTLNDVRCLTSRVKAGGLAMACTAGKLIVLVLSDVLNDSLPVIGSGPCMPRIHRLVTINKKLFDLKISKRDRAIVAQAERALKEEASVVPCSPTNSGNWITPQGCHVTHLTLGTNSLAVDAAATTATALGYKVVSATSNAHSDSANTVGLRLAVSLNTMVTTCETTNRPLCLLEGGEATVNVPNDHGQGGRNQHTVVAAANDILMNQQKAWPTKAILASFGTDGEDGPTSSAGGFVDTDVAKSLALHPNKILEAIGRCNSYELLKSAGGLIETGPTGTNVADVRIVLTNPRSD